MPGALRVFHFVSYLAFRVAEGLIHLLPIEWAFEVGRAGGELAYRILWRRRAVALANLRLAFAAELSEAELHGLNRRHFQLLGANLLSGVKASSMSHDEIWERVSATIPDERPRIGWIALISHIGNWELYSHLGEKYPEYQYGAVYQPLANPFIDKHIREARRRSGIRLFDRRTELLSCLRFLREGGVVGVLVDQRAGYAGVWTPLFGRLTSSSTLAATFAIRANLPVLPIAINTCGRARWQMAISEPLYPNEHDPELLTAEINRLLEQQIRRAPADWLWAHKRWKPLRPHFLFARDQRRAFFPPNFDRSTLDRFRILVISPDSAEEAGATFPAVRAIKEGRPDTAVTVLACESIAGVWKGNDVVDSLLRFNARISVSGLTSKIRTAARFDVAIFFGSSWKVALAVWRSGIPLRVGRRSGATSWLFNQHPAEPNQPLDAMRLSLHIAHSVGANVNAAILEEPIADSALRST